MCWVIDVSHHSDNRRPRYGNDVVLLPFVCQKRFRIVQLRGFCNVAHFFDHDHGRFLVDYLIDGDHATEFHQNFDHFGRLNRHLLSKCGDGNGLRDQHFSNDGFRRRKRLLRNGRFGLMPASTT